ncbi:MAG TPA: hypothetical protein VF627_03440 [Abditibacterium sp.]|jgi:hypothetical protein
MKVTQVVLRPTPASEAAGRPALTLRFLVRLWPVCWSASAHLEIIQADVTFIINKKERKWPASHFRSSKGGDAKWNYIKPLQEQSCFSLSL